MKLSAKTISNLTKIKNELPILAQKIPSIREEFNMEHFGCYNALQRHHIVHLNRCNTVGCGLGNAARLFNLNKDIYYGTLGWFDYYLFCKDILPDLIEDGKGCDQVNETWKYLFSDVWTRTDYNDFDSFIERIENLLAHGELVENFSYKKNKIIS